MSAANEEEPRAAAQQRLDDALSLGDGPQKIAVLEEAVRLADASGDLALRYTAREDLVQAAYFGGSPEKAIVAYSWCLAQFDRHPERFDEWRILWRYKWMVNVIIEFPQIPLTQIYEMLDDMARRFRAGGYSLRPVFQYRYRIARFLGERELAEEHYCPTQAEQPDTASDCAACRIDEQVAYHVYIGRDLRALELAAPLFDRRLGCRTVPQRTYSRLLLPLLRLGRDAQALDFHQRGYQMVRDETGLLEYLSEHLVYLAVAGDAEAAARLFEKHYPLLEVNRNVFECFTFERAAWVFFGLLSDAGVGTMPLQMPDSFPPRSDDGDYETAQLRDWFGERVRETARRFDERNGNDHFTREWTDISELNELVGQVKARAL